MLLEEGLTSEWNRLWRKTKRWRRVDGLLSFQRNTLIWRKCSAKRDSTFTRNSSREWRESRSSLKLQRWARGKAATTTKYGEMVLMPDVHPHSAANPLCSVIVASGNRSRGHPRPFTGKTILLAVLTFLELWPFNLLRPTFGSFHLAKFGERNIQRNYFNTFRAKTWVAELKKSFNNGHIQRLFCDVL